MLSERHHALLALSPLDGRYAELMKPLRHYFSEFALIKHRVEIEILWFISVTENRDVTNKPCLSDNDVAFLNEMMVHFSLEDAERIKDIENETKHDVKAIEYFIKEKIKGRPDILDKIEFVHFGLTSEDINNLANGLMLKDILNECLIPKIESILLQLNTLSKDYAGLPMLAHTHGQPATPTTLGKEFGNFAERVRNSLNKLVQLPIKGKLNGATGNYNALVHACPNVDWMAMSKRFVMHLGLEWNAFTTQIEPHDYLIDIFDALKHISIILDGLDRDIWMYISYDYLKLKVKDGEVGSSTMPHKVNPIDFENSEGNLGMAIASLEFMSRKLGSSRMQRDLSDSTVLRNIGAALGNEFLGFASIEAGLKKITPNAQKMAIELRNHLELLAEPIQTVMRRYGIENSYEQLKFFSRGKAVTRTDIDDLINRTSLPQDEKQRLLNLTPETYTGLAEKLTMNMNK
jgi:adenylosuccinate lyase